MSTPWNPPIPVDPRNPLSGPYRTGSYLISDAGPDNTRNAMTLKDHPYRASGSHQLSLPEFVSFFGESVMPYRPKKIHLVDLREETHGFFNGFPVSWYSDNDFSNVGAAAEWIIEDEKKRLETCRDKWMQIFEIEDDSDDDLQQERVLPTSVTSFRPAAALTEEEGAAALSAVLEPTVIVYKRLPVTDHCAPNRGATMSIPRVGNDEWVHFHCHGGDGRTTTFLALYDMASWKSRGEGPLPPVETFAERQCELSNYCLIPSGCSCGQATTGWKLPLAEARWKAIQEFYDSSFVQGYV